MTANPQQYLGTKYFYQLIGSHRGRLKGFNKIHLKFWDNLFTKDNSEAALCEAGTRKLLEELNVNVEPCSLGGNDPNPDFKQVGCVKFFCTRGMDNYGFSVSHLGRSRFSGGYYSLFQ